jgi:hypothetical protein
MKFSNQHFNHKVLNSSITVRFVDDKPITASAFAKATNTSDNGTLTYKADRKLYECTFERLGYSFKVQYKDGKWSQVL